MSKKRAISYSYKKDKETKDLKVILLGEPGVGKTNIISRFISNKFDGNSNPTLGSTFGDKEIEREQYIYKLKIWDTTGQEKYHSITKLFIKGSHIVILVYSVDNLESFENLKFWNNYLKEELNNNNYVLAVVGNKKDLIYSEVVGDEMGKKYAEDNNAIFRLVSAKCDSKGINTLFETLLDEYIKKFKGDVINESFYLDDKNSKKKKCC